MGEEGFLELHYEKAQRREDSKDLFSTGVPDYRFADEGISGPETYRAGELTRDAAGSPKRKSTPTGKMPLAPKGTPLREKLLGRNQYD